jgi:hypothetical protein
VVREVGATIIEEAGEDGAVMWDSGSTLDEVEQGIDTVVVLVIGDDVG